MRGPATVASAMLQSVTIQNVMSIVDETIEVGRLPSLLAFVAELRAREPDTDA